MKRKSSPRTQDFGKLFMALSKVTNVVARTDDLPNGPRQNGELKEKYAQIKGLRNIQNLI